MLIAVLWVLSAVASASEDAGWADVALASCPSDEDVLAAIADTHVDLAIDGEELLTPDRHRHRFVMFYEPW